MKLSRLAVVGLLLAAATLPASAQADLSISLCDVLNVIDLDLKINHLGGGVHAVHGIFHEPTKKIAVTGTAIEDGGIVRLGLTLNNAGVFIPVMWELELDPQTLQGAGQFEWLTAGELIGPLEVVEGPCVPAEGAVRNTAPLGIGRPASAP